MPDIGHKWLGLWNRPPWTGCCYLQGPKIGCTSYIGNCMLWIISRQAQKARAWTGHAIWAPTSMSQLLYSTDTSPSAHTCAPMELVVPWNLWYPITIWQRIKNFLLSSWINESYKLMWAKNTLLSYDSLTRVSPAEHRQGTSSQWTELGAINLVINLIYREIWPEVRIYNDSPVWLMT